MCIRDSAGAALAILQRLAKPTHTAMAELSRAELQARFEKAKAQAPFNAKYSKLVVPPRAEHVIHPGARGLSASQADKDRGYVELKGDKKAFIANGGLGRPPGMMCLLLMTARETSPTREVPPRPRAPRGRTGC